MRIVRKDSFTTTPWKNGGGVTHEAFRMPPGAGAFRWRMSVAEIREDGPFSDFGGYGRTMVLLRGAGLRLKFPDGRRTHLRAVGDLIEFDGAPAPACRLSAGPCVDLNLIAANSLAGVESAVLRVAEARSLTVQDEDAVLVFCIEGSLRVAPAADGAAVLGAWDLAVVTAADGLVSASASASASAAAAAAAAAGSTPSPAEEPSPLVFLATVRGGAAGARP
jgi:environmental stress-induced protein Ves